MGPQSRNESFATKPRPAKAATPSRVLDHTLVQPPGGLRAKRGVRPRAGRGRGAREKGRCAIGISAATRDQAGTDRGRKTRHPRSRRAGYAAEATGKAGGRIPAKTAQAAASCRPVAGSCRRRWRRSASAPDQMQAGTTPRCPGDAAPRLPASLARLRQEAAICPGDGRAPTRNGQDPADASRQRTRTIPPLRPDGRRPPNCGGDAVDRAASRIVRNPPLRTRRWRASGRKEAAFAASALRRPAPIMSSTAAAATDPRRRSRCRPVPQRGRCVLTAVPHQPMPAYIATPKQDAGWAEDVGNR